MLRKIRAHWWVPVALIGIGMLWLLSAAWNFSHAYILAGGDSPLVLLEGKMMTWNGTAMAIGLASVGSDIIKAVSGFILVGACINKSLTWPKRIGAVVIAATLCIPTFAWSVRSATGMAALAFGDTIAGRHNDLVATNALSERITQVQGRLGWLERQTSDVGRVRRDNAREATELRKELRDNRKEMRGSKGIGGADPGGKVIADVTGMTEQHVTNWTIVLFILMVEIASTLGFPALALAAAVAPSEGDGDNSGRRRPIQLRQAGNLDEPANSNGHNEKREDRNGFAAFDHGARGLAAPAASVATADTTASHEAEEPDHTLEILDDKPSRQRRRGGRRPMACLGDGHIEEYAEHCSQREVRAARKDYEVFCKDRNLEPMSVNRMWYGLRRYRRLGEGTILRFFEPARAAIGLPH